MCYAFQADSGIHRHAAQWACGMEVTNHMNQIQIITDAGSDIIDCSRPDLTVLPMTIRFGEEEYLTAST